MLRAQIRSTETRTVDVKGEGLEEIYAALSEARPDGYDLAKAPVAMGAGETAITANGTFVRRDSLRDIEAETMGELHGLVPEGWQMLYVLRD